MWETEVICLQSAFVFLCYCGVFFKLTGLAQSVINREMLCTLRCSCYYLFVFAIMGFIQGKKTAFIVPAVGVYVSLWKVCDKSDHCVKSNEAAVCKTNSFTKSFESSASLHSPIVLYRLRQQTTASEIPRSVSDWGCSILSWHIVVFFSKLTDLLVYPLSFFFLLVFVLRMFPDWCCDNYKDCAAGFPVSRKTHTESLFSLDN